MHRRAVVVGSVEVLARVGCGVLGAARLRHSGERIFYVAPWLSRLSGVTMTLSRLSRRVWAARKGFCGMPKMTEDQERLVCQLLGIESVLSNGP